MTKLYGLTYTILNNNVIGFGKKCFCWNIYLAKVPKRRLKGYCYITDSTDVVWNMLHNSEKFRFFGYVSIDSKDIE